MILEAFEAPLRQLGLHGSAVMVQTESSEMLQNKLMPQERSVDDTGSLQTSITAAVPARQRRNGPDSDL